MEQFIPRDKLSKKARRALDTARRKDWGALSPITRKSPNPKAYDRNKARKAAIPSDGLCFCLSLRGGAAQTRPARTSDLGATIPTAAVSIKSRTR